MAVMADGRVVVSLDEESIMSTTPRPDTKLTIGSLFSGVGGLDLAVERFFDAETIWHCEFDKQASKVLAARWPSVPNHGDVTTIDWSRVEPVDILCGGFPCQDLSLAGRRSGMRPGTRSGLWSDFRAAIAALQPKVVVIENVRGLLSGCAESDSDMEPCQGCLGASKQHRPSIRALGRVLGDLATFGFDAEWCSVRASDVGAPHERFRVFVVAYTPDIGHEWSRFARDWRSGPENDRSGHLALLPTPMASEAEKAGQGPRRSPGQKFLTNVVHELLSQSGVPVSLLPTPSASNPNDEEGDTQGNVVGDVAWGKYEPAVRRWEELTRPAPEPIRSDGKNGARRLSPLLSEWMMGYPAGWVTDIIDRNPAIKACGNGVVPQQAFHALGILWMRIISATSAGADIWQYRQIFR